MLRFEVAQPVHQRIVFAIADFRLIEYVIQMLVAV